MRLTTPKTPAPGGGVEPAVRYDFLSSDEFRGMGGVLMPAATPPSVNQGLVLDGATQYARARCDLRIPTQFTLYFEFMPTFAYDLNAQKAFCDGDAAGTRFILYKNNNAALNALTFITGVGVATVNGANYSGLWQQNSRNRICIRAVSAAVTVYLNGVSLVMTSNGAWTLTQPLAYYTIGADFTGSSNFAGTIYDMRIYTRLVTAAEAIEMTTVT